MWNNSAKYVGGVNVVHLCTSSGHALYLCQFCDIISNGIEVIEWTQFLYRKLQRGIILQKAVGGVTIVNLCTSSGHALYSSTKFCDIILNGIKNIEWT